MTDLPAHLLSLGGHNILSHLRLWLLVASKGASSNESRDLPGAKLGRENLKIRAHRANSLGHVIRRASPNERRSLTQVLCIGCLGVRVLRDYVPKHFSYKPRAD